MSPKRLRTLVHAALLLLAPACATAPAKRVPAAAARAPIDATKRCSDDEPRHRARSEELQQIVAADQKERDNWQDWSQLPREEFIGIFERDLARRMRVGEIFGEGCIVTPRDYAAAALVFQHSNAPDHYYQTFLWSRRGVELGDPSQKHLMALGIDRYLMFTGRKQLFASQMSPSGAGQCYCLEQVEPSFPQAKRQEYLERSIADALKLVDGINEGKNCPAAAECAKPLAPTPQGSLPGFW
jgi:hypothetical protein